MNLEIIESSTIERPTITEPSERSVRPSDSSIVVPNGVRAWTVRTTSYESEPDALYSDKPLRRPNRNKPIIDYGDPTGLQLTRATEQSGALAFWDDPGEGECSEDHGDEA